MSWSDGEIKWAGLIFALLTTFTYGTYIVALNRPHLKALNADALTFYVLAFTALFYLLTAGLRRNLVLNFTPHFLFDMSMLGILSTVISAPAFGGGCGAYRIGSDFCTGHPGTDYSYHYRCFCFSRGIRN